MKGTAQKEVWDVIVVGGGPAGMMAAGTAAARGKCVLLLEKNKTLGVKLLITGGGRCNVTNNKQEVRTMLAKYKGNDKFLFSAFSQFNVKDALEFFNKRGMATKEENEGRIFPVSNSARSVFDVLVAYMKENRVVIETGAEVKNITRDSTTGELSVHVKNKQILRAHAAVVATGGVSRPETGSTGDGYKWLASLGHTVTPPSTALVPIALRDAWAKRLGGVSLASIKLMTYQNNQKQEVYKGKLLFTHFGISGPTVLNMSRDVGELLKYGEVTILLDLFPNLDPGALKEKVQALLTEESNKKIKNALSKIIPAALVEPMLALAGINGETANHSIRAKERTTLIALLKAVPLHVQELLGSDKAVVSSGGVDLREVNFKTMESRIVPHLYLVGDTLNIDRPSGGYSLQLCWTTGFVAGSHC